MPPVAENARRSDAVVCTNKTHMLLLEVLCELLHRNENNTLIFMQTGREQVSASCAAAPTVLLLRLLLLLLGCRGVVMGLCVFLRRCRLFSGFKRS